MIKLLIDCDTGVDDSIALLFALHRKDVEVMGISTSIGNVTAAQAADNTMRVLKFAGKEGQVPVCVGAEKPMVGTCEDFPDFIHGKNGLGEIELPESSQKPVDMDVCDFLYEKACEADGEAVLVTLGRMTNIAHTLQKYPDFPAKIKRVVSMGGTVNGPGNVAPMVEANIGGDPEAADLVLMAPWQVTMVGLDVTLKTVMHMEDVKMARSYCREECRPVLDFMMQELQNYMKGARMQNWMLECCPLHDPLAMIVAVDPGVVLTQKRITRVETGGTYCRGMFVTDLREQPIEGRFVEHCMQVDERKALNELFAVFN